MIAVSSKYDNKVYVAAVAKRKEEFRVLEETEKV
jgi:hypothetical protein